MAAVATVLYNGSPAYTNAGTSWTAFVSGGSWDVVIAASTGDVIELGVSLLWSNSPSGTQYSYLDAATIVSGSPVNWVSTGTGSHTDGVLGWFVAQAAGAFANANGSWFYTVQSGDVSGGNVTFRLYGKVVSGSRGFSISAPMHFWGAVCSPAPATSALTGTINVVQPTWMALTGSVTVAATAGDVLACSLNGRLNNGTPVPGVLDAATIVSGSPVHYFGNGGTTPGSGAGAWRVQNTDYSGLSGTVLYTVQSGDVSGGNVTVKIYGAIGSSGSRVLDSGSQFAVKKVV